jgi:ribonuclease P protein component
MEFNDKSPVKIVISIPKRIIKKATKRNRIRRQLKEIYRLNKSSLIADFESKPKGLAIFLIYTGKENEAFEFLEAKLKLVLNELQRKI